uniref:SIAH-type domain-containing protein n=1 Tax=Triticum urartu TaxID=4572 RepID=A0A8R7UZA7_TRIUA
MQGGGGEGGGAVTAAGEAMAPVQIDVRMDVALLHCQACLLPLKPPVFKCEAAGHVVCCFCRAGHATLCSRAGTHCGELDAVVGAAKVPCPYKVFGCERYVVYHGAADHQRACQCAPCSCPEPGCVFVGSRAMLLDHFAAGHQRHAVTVRYGRPWNLGFSLSRRWHVLVGEDRSVFLSPSARSALPPPSRWSTSGRTARPKRRPSSGASCPWSARRATARTTWSS